MEPIVYINRETGDQEVERVYGAAALNFLYGNDFFSRLFGPILLHLLVKNSLFSALYGQLQKLPSSKKKIRPFIETFGVDASEFQDSVESFSSFNDFFIRKLKPETRPIAEGDDVAIIPADGRYRFYQNIEETEGFIVKGEKFDLVSLIGSEELASKYTHGSMVMARLCPMDYHRYHFPCDCIPGPPRLINGRLYSVNPVALRKDIHIFTQNKRVICELLTRSFGRVLFIEVGATNVGSIHQTYQAGRACSKGDEKGYFSFGGSSIILLFEPKRILFDADLLYATSQGMEIKCLFGQRLGCKF